MLNQEYMTVNGMPVPINGEKNVVEIIHKAGIKLPTFCYYRELSIYGAYCMCMVENEWGGLDAACSAQPYVPVEEKRRRAQSLYAADKMSSCKHSEENPLIMGLFSGILKGKVHGLRQVHYESENPS